LVIGATLALDESGRHGLYLSRGRGKVVTGRWL